MDKSSLKKSESAAGLRQELWDYKRQGIQGEAKFTGWAAKYVAERFWSPDQKIKKIGKNKIVLEFTASSESEVIS